MELTLAELSMRVQNLIRFSTIAKIKHGRTPQVRLQFGGIKIGILPLATAQAGKTTTWNPTTVVERYALPSPSFVFAGEVVIPDIASSHNPTPNPNPDNNRTEYP